MISHFVLLNCFQEIGVVEFSSFYQHHCHHIQHPILNGQIQWLLVLLL